MGIKRAIELSDLSDPDIGGLLMLYTVRLL